MKIDFFLNNKQLNMDRLKIIVIITVAIISYAFIIGNIIYIIKPMKTYFAKPETCYITNYYKLDNYIINKRIIHVLNCNLYTCQSCGAKCEITTSNNKPYIIELIAKTPNNKIIYFTDAYAGKIMRDFVMNNINNNTEVACYKHNHNYYVIYVDIKNSAKNAMIMQIVFSVTTFAMFSVVLLIISVMYSRINNYIILPVRQQLMGE